MKKNLLFIFADQMHRYALNCMGTADISTPNLDQLAKEGVLFRNAYSNCPICTPFRINLFSGLYTCQTNTYRNESQIPKRIVTFADELNKNGYQPSFVGKWHIGKTGNGPIPLEIRGGFSNFIGYQCYNGFNKDVNFYDENGVEHHYNRHRTDITTEIAIDRLEHIKESPFAMFIGYQAPHYPVQPSSEFEKSYHGKQIKKRPNFQNIDPYTPTHSPKSAHPKELCTDFQKYGNNIDEYLRLYYGMVSQVDAGVGKIIHKLKEWGIYEKTIIIFTADHGDMQGSHGLKNKTSPWEESSGIPLIIKTPGGISNMICEYPVSGVDFFPTCLAALNIKTNLSLPGNNFASFLHGGEFSSEKPIFSEMPEWKMIRCGDYKLVVRGRRLKPTEFFNLKRDPYEMENLVHIQQHSRKINEFRDLIKNWLKTCKKFNNS